MIRSISTLLSAALVLAATTANAQAPSRTPAPAPASSPYLSVTASFGWALGDFAHTEQLVANGMWSDTFHGYAVGGRLAAGVFVTPNLALAMEGGVLAQPSLTKLASNTVYSIAVFHLGPSLDWYPDRSGPWHVQSSLQFQTSSVSAYEYTDGGPATPVGGSGVLERVGMGYDFLHDEHGMRLGPMFELVAAQSWHLADHTGQASALVSLSARWF